MQRSRFGTYWFHEFENHAFVIDLRSWGVNVNFNEYWSVQLLCFTWEKIG